MNAKLLVGCLFGVVLFTSACGGNPPASNTTVLTWGQAAAAGQSVFAGNCAICHGSNGQGITGPAIIGPSEALVKYQTAQGLLQFISAAMPLSNPGSLSPQQYSDVLTYLLVQNQFVNSTAPFDANQIASIPLK